MLKRIEDDLVRTVALRDDPSAAAGTPLSLPRGLLLLRRRFKRGLDRRVMQRIVSIGGIERLG
ncbi:hypothetical protein GCM10022213_21630 [Parerythrobacter jejuensis]